MTSKIRTSGKGEKKEKSKDQIVFSKISTMDLFNGDNVIRLKIL